MTVLRPDGRPWVWDDPDLPVGLFVAEYRRLRPESHLSDLEVRDRWRHGTRIDSSSRLHHYPWGPVKSWAEAEVEAVEASGTKRCPMCNGVGWLEEP